MATPRVGRDLDTKIVGLGAGFADAATGLRASQLKAVWQVYSAGSLASLKSWAERQAGRVPGWKEPGVVQEFNERIAEIKRLAEGLGGGDAEAVELAEGEILRRFLRYAAWRQEARAAAAVGVGGKDPA